MHALFHLFYDSAFRSNAAKKKKKGFVSKDNSWWHFDGKKSNPRSADDRKMLSTWFMTGGYFLLPLINSHLLAKRSRISDLWKPFILTNNEVFFWRNKIIHNVNSMSSFVSNDREHSAFLCQFDKSYYCLFWWPEDKALWSVQRSDMATASATLRAMPLPPPRAHKPQRRRHRSRNNPI